LPGETAGWWRRLAGYLVDGAIIGVVGSLLHLSRETDLLLTVAYWVLLVGYQGNATLGMRLLGMKVVPSDGRPQVTYLDALIRWLMMIVGAICLFLGFLWAAWDARHQAWHDKVARTLVVRA
jgi:uncharacterized RDD family membrane protein YckC